jgi:UPF0716 family protein affecting phage T7 exclusion
MRPEAACSISHLPNPSGFIFVVLSAVMGGLVFTRVLGASAVRRLLERLRSGSDRGDKSDGR